MKLPFKETNKQKMRTTCKQKSYIYENHNNWLSHKSWEGSHFPQLWTLAFLTEPNQAKTK